MPKPGRIDPSLLKTSPAKLHQARPSISFGASTGLGISLLYISYPLRRATNVPGWANIVWATFVGYRAIHFFIRQQYAGLIT